MHIVSLSIGIIGLPNVGKSTLFNALLKRQAALAANYPFATIEPNLGVVDVPDSRIDRLVEIVRIDYGNKAGDREIPEKIIPATVNFYDIAGLVKGASQGEGLGNAFLGHIREVDALVHVVRAFTDENVIKAGAVSPEEDISTINTELILADLQSLEKRLPKLEKDLKTDKSEKAQHLVSALKKAYDTLNVGKLALEAVYAKEEEEVLKETSLLTLKPIIYVFNVDEGNVNNYSVQKDSISFNNHVVISAKIESEIASIADEAEKKEFLDSLDIKESGLDKIIRKGYEMLGLQTFFTLGPKEVRAWTTYRGSTAPEAAGRIHTDFQKGFISAEIINFKDLDSAGSEKHAKTLGLVRLEGKSYIMQDGDCVEFHFSV